MTQFNPDKIQQEVSNYWDENNVRQKVRESTEGNEPFFLIDGPPYLNGSPHVGHMQGKVIKDMMLRFKQMQGYDVWDQAGFDTHGLPNEIATEEELAKNCEYGRYSSDLQELEAQEEYRKVYEVYLEMQDESVENYEEDRELDRDKMIILFELESEFHITSSIATNMSTRNLEWIHLVIQVGDDKVNISGRCQSGRVDLGKLMQEALPEEAVEEGAEAGRHEKAAGAYEKGVSGRVQAAVCRTGLGASGWSS